MLVLEVSWVGSAYEATHDSRPEWPPHPARAFCALVSAADPGSADDDALRWLEALPPPQVHAPLATGHRRQAFVVTNAVVPAGGHQVHLGRTSGSRAWARSVPSRPVARFVWPDADADDQQVARLDRLARLVPYLGRSTSPALLRFSVTAPAAEPDVGTYVPHAGGRCRLRVPHRGYLDQLRAAFGDPLADRVTVRATAYRAPGEAVAAGPRAPAVNRIWPHMVTLGLEPGDPVDGRHAVAVAAGFKAAILSRLGTPQPGDDWEPLAPDALALLHGHYDHGADNRRQCAVMALPFVGHQHSTGDLLGVGLAVSANLEAEVLTPLLRLLGYDRPPEEGPRLRHISVGRGRVLRLRRADPRHTVDPTRWTAESREWRTVLPIVLDRFPRRRYTLADAVADGCEWAGFDRPEKVEVYPASLVVGAPSIPRSDLQRRGGPPRPAVHARVRFARPVKGPMLLGHLRHLGLGLCVPPDSPRSAT